MRGPDSPFRHTVKLIPLALLVAAAAVAADVPQPVRLSDQVEKLIKDALPVCAEEATVSRGAVQHTLPTNMVATVVRVQSKRQACEGQWLGIVSNEGGFYMGIPWFLDEETGTLEEKLKNFGWKNLQQNFSATIDRQKTREGLYKVTLLETTERGKLPFRGAIDPAGTIFFIGDFFPINVDFRTSRLKVFEPFVANSPTEGASKPVVTVIEFSDFECPSCQRAAGYMKPILAKYGDSVRYIRYDLPLITMHPWAFPAAVAGRAIYRQKPDVFWQYKEQVYSNQEKLNAFTIDDFARGFAQDHDLDLKKYDADVNSPELKASIMDGAGAALSNDIRATPSYLVNGTNVDAGTDGKPLEAYVANLLKK
jgi:protein-disulfide isomerase